MAKGHWVRVHEGRGYEKAIKALTQAKKQYTNTKMTSHRLGIGTWYTVWKWVIN